MKKKLIGLVLSVTILGCGNQIKTTPSVAPSGPISYEYIQEIYESSSTNTVQLHSLSSGGCGIIADNVGGITGALSFIPVLGVTFGSVSAVANYVGAGAGSSCFTQQFSTITNTLNYQSTEIQNLQVGVSYLSNQFAAEYYTVATEIAALANYNYTDSLQYFIGNNSGVYGVLSSLMQNLGAWSSPVTVNPNFTDSNLGSTAGIAVISPGPATQYSFQNNLQNISGTSYTTNCSSDCYKNVTKDLSNTALILSLNSLYVQLQSNVNQYLQNNNQSSTNIVTLVDGYNNTINGMYIQAINAMQEAYSVEYMVNLANYEYVMNNYYSQGVLPPSATELVQSPSYSQVPGTLFNYNLFYINLGAVPTESQIVTEYNTAQKQLAYMYAARLNSLYQIILSYTLSDPLIGNQAYPTNSYITAYVSNQESSFYNPLTYNLINSGAGLSSPLILLGLNNLNINGLSNTSYMAYQYTINNVNQCISSMNSYNNNSSNPNFIDMITNSSSGFVCNSIYNDSTVHNENNQPSYLANYLPAQWLELYYAPSTSSAPTLLSSPSFNNLSNNAESNGSLIYNISNYPLQYVSYNNLSYLVAGNYNLIPQSSAWSSLGITQLTVSPAETSNVVGNSSWQRYANIDFYFISSISNFMNTKWLSADTLDPANQTVTNASAGQLAYFNTNANSQIQTYFNPPCIFYDEDDADGTVQTACGTGQSNVYYTLPDGIPILLQFVTTAITTYHTTTLPVVNINVNYQSTNSLVTCGNNGVCTTAFGNQFQFVFGNLNNNGGTLSVQAVN